MPFSFLHFRLMRGISEPEKFRNSADDMTKARMLLQLSIQRQGVLGPRHLQNSGCHEKRSR